MRRIGIITLLCLLLALGCKSDTGTAPEETAQPTSAPTATAAPTAEPTPEPTPAPIVVAGSMAVDGVLTAVVTAEDFALIEQIPDLKALDVSGSDCYDAILAYRDAHPAVDVRYTVPIGDDLIDSGATEATVTSVPDASLLGYLPALQSLIVTEPMTPDGACAMLEALPAGAAATYAVEVFEEVVSCAETALDWSAVPPKQAEEAALALRALPNVTDVQLDPGKGSSQWTLEQVGLLMAVRPTVRVAYTTKVFGVKFCLTDEVVTFNSVSLRNRVDELRVLLPYLRNVTRLEILNSGVPNETMAALRAEFQTPKIVWNMEVGPYDVRTDSIMLRLMGKYETYPLKNKDVGPLQYCNEVRFLDLGHNQIQNPDFVAFMPDLEVCILAIGQPTDLSAFANCPKLEYLEVFHGYITDVSPLANCTELKHLNLCMNEITDITPLYGLTKLERLWISRNPIPEEQIAVMQSIVPNCVINTTCKDPTLNEWRFDPTRPGGYSERYALLRRQFRYDDNGPRWYNVLPDDLLN